MVGIYDTSGGYNVSDYRQKKAVAEALRGKQEAMLARSRAPDTITTAANGNYPGVTQVNWGGILGNLGQDWQNAKGREAAIEAEAGVDTARQAALDKLMKPQAGAWGGDGMGPQGPDVAPTYDANMALALSELGISDGVSANIKETMQGDKPNLTVMLQTLSSNPSMGQFYVSKGWMKPEEVDSYINDMDARKEMDRAAAKEDYLWEQNNKRFAPTAASYKDPSQMAQWLAENPGKGVGDYMEFQARLKRKEGLPLADGQDTPMAQLPPSLAANWNKEVINLQKNAEAANKSLGDEARLRELVADESIFTPENAEYAARLAGGGNGMVDNFLKTAARAALPKQVIELQGMLVDPNLARMAQLGGNDSEQELAYIQAALPSAMQSQEGAQRLLDRYLLWQRKLAYISDKRAGGILDGRVMSQDEGRRNAYSPKSLQKEADDMFGVIDKNGRVVQTNKPVNIPMTQSAKDAGITQEQWNGLDDASRGAFP